MTKPSARVLFPVALLLVLAGGSFLLKATLSGRAMPPSDVPLPERIVSMSPSVTEIVYALGCGERLVGRTRYCLYPPEVQTKPEIGGYLDPSYEAIVALQPDLVITQSGESHRALEELGLRVLAVRHDTAEGILDSITAVGRACGAENQASQLTADLRAQVRRMEQRAVGADRLPVLLVVDRPIATGKIRDACVAGSDGFMNRMIELAGGYNACPTTGVSARIVSAEGILKMNPQVIVELIAPQAQAGLSHNAILADWRQLPEIAAVRNDRIHILDADYAFIPGPRFVRLAEDLGRLVHPEWKEEHAGSAP